MPAVACRVDEASLQAVDRGIRLRGVAFAVRSAASKVPTSFGVFLSSERLRWFVPVPPKLAVGDLMRLMKGRASHEGRRDLPQLKCRY